MRTVLAKFICAINQRVHCGRKLQKNEDGTYAQDEHGAYIELGEKYQENISFNAVCGEENKPWSEYTPSGTLTLSITNEALLGHFQPGKHYMLEIKEVE